jgi:protein transport protein YIF1
MSFITYVLLCAMVYGNAGKFSPQVISQVATLCFGCQVVEVLGMRFGIYMLQSPIPVLDLLSYTGYKYLGLCVNMIAGITLSHFGMGKEAYYIFFVYTSLAACWFMLKTLANNIPISSSSGRNRDMMVLAFAVSQAIVMYLVGKTKFLT